MDEWIDGAIEHYYHPVGTCAMGAVDDPLAVTDAKGRVHGLENVFVADCSIMPVIPRANTNLSTGLATRTSIGNGSRRNSDSPYTSNSSHASAAHRGTGHHGAGGRTGGRGGAHHAAGGHAGGGHRGSAGHH